ncbi:MAG: ATPase [Deltaproteobacteria bacterium]|nr:ATPase [Deltaproteobacteria bacterium]MBW1793601.1 ATPase [Deltaproteobacteria bacterium]
MDKSQYSRRDRMIQEKRHDTYRERGKWPEPTVCSECGSLFQDGRWSWNKPTKEANKVVCPACQRIADNCPAGYVEIRGGFFERHREELLNLIRREEELEKGEHPMERIISIVDEENHTLVTTTGVHIAGRIGKVLSRACQGNLSIQYGDDEKSIRVYWSR